MSISIGSPYAPGAVNDAWREAHDACDEAEIRVDSVHASADCERLTRVLSTVWDSPSRDIMDGNMVTAMAHAGNLVTAAYQGDDLVGGSAGFCGPPGAAFHSHIVGLLPSAAGRGLGRAIKLYQRAWCLEREIATMTWTYDPLVARNAYFNIQRLGTAAVEYLPNFYGEMADGINAGQGSDRMLIRWDLASRRAPLEKQHLEALVHRAHPAVVDVSGRPSSYRAPQPSSHTAVIAVPENVELLRQQDPQAGVRWRTEIRRAFQDLMSQGWQITGFSRSAHYVLTMKEPHEH